MHSHSKRHLPRFIISALVQRRCLFLLLSYLKHTKLFLKIKFSFLASAKYGMFWPERWFLQQQEIKKQMNRISFAVPTGMNHGSQFWEHTQKILRAKYGIIYSTYCSALSFTRIVISPPKRTLLKQNQQEFLLYATWTTLTSPIAIHFCRTMTKSTFPKISNMAKKNVIDPPCSFGLW